MKNQNAKENKIIVQKEIKNEMQGVQTVSNGV